MAQDTRDTCWPCRTDAACCVPVGPGESLKKETVQPQGGNTFCCRGDDWLIVCSQGSWDIPKFSLRDR